MLNDALANTIREAAGDALLLDARRDTGLVTDVTQLYDTCQRLRNLGFSQCVDLTALETEAKSEVRSPQSGAGNEDGAAAATPDTGRRTPHPAFQLFLLLRLPAQSHARLQLKWKYTQTDTSLHPSLSRIWPSAGLAEREIWEMLGIAFAGNDNLAPLLLDPQFEGYPLRRDFALPRPASYAAQLLQQRHEAGLLVGTGLAPSAKLNEAVPGGSRAYARPSTAAPGGDMADGASPVPKGGPS